MCDLFSLNAFLSSPAVVRDDSDVYIIGGMDGETPDVLDTVYKYDLTNAANAPILIAILNSGTLRAQVIQHKKVVFIFLFVFFV